MPKESRYDYAMRRWALSLNRLKAQGRKRGAEFRRAAFWAAAWGAIAMAARGITRFPTSQPHLDGLEPDLPALRPGVDLPL